MPDTNMNMNNNNGIKNYNYLKSIKEKENIIVSYYKKLSHLGTDKPKILPKIKKRTLKKTKIAEHTSTKSDSEIHEHKKYSEKEKENNIEKKTKKQIVIMDD